MPTTLAQMGNVAKAQARGQHGTQQAAPFHEQQEKKDDLKVQRVQEAKAPGQGRVEPDEDRKDKRQRRRLRRARRQVGSPDGDPAGTAGEQDDVARDAEGTLGATIDLRI